MKDSAIASMNGFRLKGHPIEVAPAKGQKKQEESDTKFPTLSETRSSVKPARKPVEIKGLFGNAPFQTASSDQPKPDVMLTFGRVVKVANVPDYFGRVEVDEIFKVFGPIMDISVVPHKREAYVHYYEKDHAQRAVITMEGCQVGDSKLSVCIDPQNGKMPSTLIVMEGPVDTNEVDEDLKVEILEECKKYGRVQEVRVHITSTTNEVRVFVLFTLPEEASRAVRILSKRSFNKRKVRCKLYDMELYEKSNFNA